MTIREYAKRYGLGIQKKVFLGLPVILHNGIQVEDAGQEGEFIVEERWDSEEEGQFAKDHLKAAGLREDYVYYECGPMAGPLFLNPENGKPLRALCGIGGEFEARLAPRIPDCRYSGAYSPSRWGPERRGDEIESRGSGADQ